MTRKQANRRKQKKAPKIRLPVSVIALCYQFSAKMLDQPITSITIEGPFQRVTALQIEEAISDEIGTGFFSASLANIQVRVMQLAWIDNASVGRRWPGTLEISVTEQVPAAVWGERGLLNTRGDLFVRNARHVPAELPRLEGPDGQSTIVANRYLDLKERLIPFGLDLRQVRLDPRGAWELMLTNGIGIRLGRRDVNARASLFLDVAAAIVASREAEIDYVDMRYSNGFTIAWNDDTRAPSQIAQTRETGMVAGLRE
jgi:cell division protein FtsQ